MACPWIHSSGNSGGKKKAVLPPFVSCPYSDGVRMLSLATHTLMGGGRLRQKISKGKRVSFSSQTLLTSVCLSPT